MVVDQHERFKDVIVENEVDEVVLFLCADQFLTRHEREALTQFEQEFLQVADDGSLQLRFRKVAVRSKADELRDGRVLDELHPVLLERFGQRFHLGFDRIFMLREQQPFVILRTDIAVEGTVAPHLLGSLLQIPCTSIGIGNLH